MPDKPHFVRLDSWRDAEAWLGFEPRVLAEAAGRPLESLSVFVRDHRKREVPVERRSLEAHYGVLVFTQSRPGEAEARRAACELRYGSDPMDARVAGREARAYERGPEPPPDDPDPRMPSVVVWCDGPLFFLLASGELPASALLEVAGSLYA